MALRAIAWFALAGVASAFALRALGIDSGPASYVVAVVPWITGATLLLGATVAALRQWRLTSAAGALAAVGLAWLAPLWITDGDGGEPVLTVATVNLRYGNGHADDVVAMVEERGVDLLAVEELTPEATASLAAVGIADVLPYSVQHPSPGAGGTGIYSRFPLSEGSLVAGMYFTSVRADVATPVGSVAFFAVHPRPPHPLRTDGWLADVEALAAALAEERGPVVVAGDFNSTRDHAAFRDILALGYRDAADQAGAGFLPTYPESSPLGPLVAIDHVLERDTAWRAATMVTVTVPGSDHRAVVVTYVDAA